MTWSIFANSWGAGVWRWAHIIITIYVFVVFSYLLNQVRDIFTTSVHSSCVIIASSILTRFIPPWNDYWSRLFIFPLGFLSFSPCAVGNQSARLLIPVNTISQQGWASQSEPPGADWAANGRREPSPSWHADLLHVSKGCYGNPTVQRGWVEM